MIEKDPESAELIQQLVREIFSLENALRSTEDRITKMLSREENFEKLDEYMENCANYAARMEYLEEELIKASGESAVAKKELDEANELLDFALEKNVDFQDSLER